MDASEASLPKFASESVSDICGHAARLYCGFEGAIECFDVAEPGSEGVRHALTPSRKAKNGQKGMNMRIH